MSSFYFVELLSLFAVWKTSSLLSIFILHYIDKNYGQIDRLVSTFYPYPVYVFKYHTSFSKEAVIGCVVFSIYCLLNHFTLYQWKRWKQKKSHRV